MKHPTSNIVFTPAIKALQEQYGSRKSYERMEWAEKITPDLEKFISERDSFYTGEVRKVFLRYWTSTLWPSRIFPATRNTYRWET